MLGAEPTALSIWSRQVQIRGNVPGDFSTLSPALLGLAKVQDPGSGGEGAGAEQSLPGFAAECNPSISELLVPGLLTPSCSPTRSPSRVSLLWSPRPARGQGPVPAGWRDGCLAPRT